jgi:hypothetical protein
MKVTNNESLPSGFYNACLHEYLREDGKYSVTEILKGVTEIILSRRHGDEVETDCSEMVWMVFGSAVHKVMEEHTVGDTQIAELGLEADCYGVKLKGHIDLYDAKTGRVTDYKTCSVWKVLFGDYDDWRKQLLLYTWLLRENGFNGNGGEIIALMKDHSKRDAKQKADYPQRPVKRLVFDFNEVDLDEIDGFLAGKMADIAKFDNVPDSKLPPCKAEERWAKPDTYAVKKKGRKTALRVLESQDSADAWMSANGGDYVEHRPGADVKCIDYCSVCEFCPYWQSVYGGKEEE